MDSKIEIVEGAGVEIDGMVDEDVVGQWWLASDDGQHAIDCGEGAKAEAVACVADMLSHGGEATWAGWSLVLDGHGRRSPDYQGWRR